MNVNFRFSHFSFLLLILENRLRYIRCIQLIFLTIMIHYSVAQNLILDPGFEYVKQWQWEIAGLEECLYMWSNPNESTADYFHPEASAPSFKVPHNVYGSQQAHSGEAYAGFCVTESNLEFLQTEFDEHLVKDQLYCVRLYVSKADKTPGTLQSLGVYFAPSNEFQFSKKGLGRRAEINLPVERPDDAENWQLLCAIYRAQGWEKVFILGAYEEYHTTHTHYYVDDVSIHAIENLQECGCTTDEVYVGFRRALNKWYMLENCYFDFDNSELKEESYDEIDVLANYLVEHQGIKILIQGHTDVRGKEGYNEELSLSRSESVKNRLVDSGVSADRIRTKGLGTSKLADKGLTEDNHALNRRVSYILYQANH